MLQLSAPVLDVQTRSAIERYVRAFPSFTTTASGFVPASPGGTTKYLRADGTWVVPAGAGGTTLALEGGDAATGNTSAIIVDGGTA